MTSTIRMSLTLAHWPLRLTLPTRYSRVTFQQALLVTLLAISTFSMWLSPAVSSWFGVGGPTLGGNPAIGAQQGAFVSSALGFTLIDGTESSLFNDLALGLGTNVPGNPLSPGQSLPAGTYAFVFQNTGSNTNGYELTFSGSEVVAVPEPSSAIAIIALGLTMVTRRRRS